MEEQSADFSASMTASLTALTVAHSAFVDLEGPSVSVVPISVRHVELYSCLGEAEDGGIFMVLVGGVGVVLEV